MKITQIGTRMMEFVTRRPHATDMQATGDRNDVNFSRARGVGLAAAALAVTLGVGLLGAPPASAQCMCGPSNFVQWQQGGWGGVNGGRVITGPGGAMQQTWSASPLGRTQVYQYDGPNGGAEASHTYIPGVANYHHVQQTFNGRTCFVDTFNGNVVANTCM